MTINAFRDWVLMLDMRQLFFFCVVGAWSGLAFCFFIFTASCLDDLPCQPVLVMLLLLLALRFWGLHCSKMYRWLPVKKFFYGIRMVLDFIIVVSMGMATRTNEWLYIASQASRDIIGQFPLVLIPRFAVPFYIITYLIIYVQLKQR